MSLLKVTALPRKAARKPTPPEGKAKNNAPKYPDIHVQLSGEDGNAFAIMGRVGNALRAAKVSQDEINEFYTEARMSDYNHLLQTVMSWVTVS
jgi:hypothetical protein